MLIDVEVGKKKGENWVIIKNIHKMDPDYTDFTDLLDVRDG